MPDLARRLSLLQKCRPGSVSELLAACIPSADQAELPLLAAAAVRLNQVDALAAVIEVLHRLPEPAAILLGAEAHPLTDATRLALRKGHPHTVRNLFALVRLRPDASLAPLAADALQEWTDIPELVRGAGDCLLRIVLASAGPHGRRIVPREAADALDDAVSRAAEAQRAHRLDTVRMAGALLLAQPGPRLKAMLADQDDPFTRALPSITERVDEPVVRCNLLRWMTVEPLGRSILRWLHRVEGAAAYADLLHDGHLLLVPRRARALAGADRPVRCLPSEQAVAALPLRSQAHAPLFARHLNLSDAACARFGGALASAPGAIARWRAMELFREREAMNEVVLTRFARDTNRMVARHAAHLALSDPFAPRAVLEHLTTSPHPAVASSARRRLAGRSKDAFLTMWDSLTFPARCAASIQLLGTDRASLIEALGSLLDFPRTRRPCVDALRIVLRLRLGDALPQPLLTLAGSQDSFIASCAASAIGEINSAASIDALLALIAHPDARVRSNAIDALERRRAPELSPRAIPLAVSSFNRERGSAVRALLRSHNDAAVPALQSMLEADDPLHRISGIWAARTGRARSAAPVLVRMARTDPLPPVRVRAAAALRFLERTPASAPMRVA